MLLSVLVAVQVVAGARADDVNFLLWTRSNPGDLQFHTLLLGDADNLAAAPLTPSDPTALLIHGYTSSGFTGWSRTAKTELLSYSPYNVISVDWESLAEGPWYPGAVQNTQVVGERTARLLEWLQEEAGLDTTLVQVTGHSLGAHVSGAIGQHLQGFRLQYITGLDPAGPLFHNVTSDFRLDASDAEFVQVIHTDACSIIESCLGLAEPCGHVDFYPNAGEYQPGCSDLSKQGETRGCSHSRAHDYWIESINGETPFLARPCSDWDAYVAGECDSCGQGCLEMGFHVQKGLTGNYYLRTNDAPPFAMG